MTEETSPEIAIEMSQDMAAQGRYAVVRGEERFHPTHEVAEERERFMGLFRELAFEQKVRIVERIGKEELLDRLYGVPPSQQDRRLDEAMAEWIEENERSYQHRLGYMARANGEQEGLTGDETREFKDGFRRRLIEELHNPILRQPGFDEVEAGMAKIWESAKRLRDSSEAEAQRWPWPYLTVREAPTAGEPPEWVKAAWEGVSIPVPTLKDGSRQRATFFDGPGGEQLPAEFRVHVESAIVALLADGKRDAAEWFLDRYEEYHACMLAFEAATVELHDEHLNTRR
jgi:hypothetical protein